MSSPSPCPCSSSFIVPQKITSKYPFSRFKTIDESRDFLLQQRKKAFQSSGKKLFRLETKDKVLIGMMNELV